MLTSYISGPGRHAPSGKWGGGLLISTYTGGLSKHSAAISCKCADVPPLKVYSFYADRFPLGGQGHLGF